MQHNLVSREEWLKARARQEPGEWPSLSWQALKTAPPLA
jgi:hypothetical protein